MEKIKFALRVVALLALIPAIMYADLTRDKKEKNKKKETPAVEVSTKNTSEYSLSCYFPFTQAVYN